ncbi:hypothetical protein BH721_11390 [Clostridium baratii]|uniref:Uncharacterized protein n=1 Tax=Clostridium baratii TaxID=1561 RepID=A0A174PJC0_9CLOT|nr:DUF6762 family protein [Clostridium baratii]OPF50446.1 hypothetical protein A1M12_09355 [Clostridium baratii]OPF53156.1 hypothetical protein BH721_11390 [Clostridium baratii]OPF55172.1 hypothetical protein BH724_12655 [Clostridium baratii]OPF61122.1 hypothetical protein BH725_13725 [Clostridium baratii]CUP58738.1 Uncharacterised protein [Clostridium baratii]
MDFSSLVLMEKDKETGFITKELGSFSVNEGALHVRKFFVDGDTVNLYFDTNKDVSEWEYSAIYDLFNAKVFEEEGFEISEDLDEYNPTFIVKFKYDDDHNKMQENVTKIVDLIEKEMIEVFKNIEGKEEEYKED